MAMLTRVVSVKSAMADPEGAQAIASEMQKMDKYKAFDYNDVRDWNDIRQNGNPTLNH